MTDQEFQLFRDAALAIGLNPDFLPAFDAPAAASMDGAPVEGETNVTDAEYAAIQSVLPADCGSERRDTISAALWIVKTGRPWTLLPERLGGWDAQRRRFSRWSHQGEWSRIAGAIEMADVSERRKQLYRAVAEKAARQVEMLPEYRKRVCGRRF